MAYLGRFAPTPSGRLHWGSAIAAIAAYLRALNQHGICLLRLEDLDAARCRPEYTEAILRDLNHLGLRYPEPIKIQSRDLKPYAKAVAQLLYSDHAYVCRCTRAQLKLRACTCALHHYPDDGTGAIRLRLNADFKPEFNDLRLGMIRTPPPAAGALTLRRSDGIYSYNLACVIDDAAAGITEIVRGADLIEMTPVQIFLTNCLKLPAAQYVHLPLAVNPQGLKLSKQNHAPAVLDEAKPERIIIQVLQFLGQTLPENYRDMSAPDLLAAAAEGFDLQKIPRRNAYLLRG